MKKEKISKLKHLEGTKPGFFNKVMKNLKKAVLASFATYLILMPAFNLAREIRETMQGDNKIVDVNLGFGSIVLSNKDERSPIKIYDDVLNAALKTEGLANVYDANYQWTEAQKKEFLEKIVNAMAKEAGIRVSHIVYKELGEQNVGMYVGMNFGDFSWSANKIMIDSNFFNTAPFKEVIATAVHEVAGHAVENINVLTNKNTKNAFDTTDTQYIAKIVKEYNKELYYAAPVEITAHTIEMAFNLKAHKMFVSDDYRDEDAIYREKLAPLLREVLYNEDDEIRKYTNYEQITLQEIIFNGVQKLFSNNNLPSDKETVEQSYLYQILEYGYGNYLNLTFYDYINGNSNYLRADLSKELEKLKDSIETYQNGSYKKMLSRDVDYREYTQEEVQSMAMKNLAKEMSALVRMINYNGEQYEDGLIKEAYQAISDHLNLLNEKTQEEFYLDDFKTQQKTQDLEIEFGH